MFRGVAFAYWHLYTGPSELSSLWLFVTLVPEIACFFFFHFLFLQKPRNHHPASEVHIYFKWPLLRSKLQTQLPGSYWEIQQGIVRTCSPGTAALFRPYREYCFPPLAQLLKCTLKCTLATLRGSRCRCTDSCHLMIRSTGCAEDDSLWAWYRAPEDGGSLFIGFSGLCIRPSLRCSSW